MQRPAVPRSLALDYAVGLCGVWVSAGFFLDAWAHGHVPIESFFTPYHGVFYGGMVVMLAALTGFAVRRQRYGRRLMHRFPPAYRLAVLGVPLFFAAGIGDLLWHRLAGIEEGVDALLSPTHQIIGLSLFFLASGPIRSVLADRRPQTFVRQLPMCLGLATWLILAHFGTAYAFDPAAGRINAPPPIAPFAPTYLTALSIGYYKVSLGVLTLIFQSMLMSGMGLWWVSRVRPQPGMLTIFFVLANVPAAAAFTNASPLLAITLVQSLATGIAADSIVARCDPQPARPLLLTWFAIAIAMSYSGIYVLGTMLAGGTWWDWNVALGAWIWCGVCAYALSLIAIARRTA